MENNESKSVILQSKQEVLCLLFIYCAHLDHKFCEKEEELIVNEFGYELFSLMLSVFEETPEVEILPLLLNNAQIYFAGDLAIDELNSELLRIFEVDGKVCRFETSFKQFINNYMNQL